MGKSYFISHNQNGIQFNDGGPPFNENTSGISNIEGNAKCFTVSSCGTKFAFIMKGMVHVMGGPKLESMGKLNHPRAQELVFSPKGTFLAVWETYVTTEGQAPPNMTIYNVNAKKLLKAFHQQSQINWQPQWTKDESIFARLTTSEVHFYDANELNEVVHKKILHKLKSFSISPSVDEHYVTFYQPGIKSNPASVTLFKYPNFKETCLALASKSFYKVDTVEVFWNSTSTALLFLTTAEVDKSGQSYYGDQKLFYMDIHGDAAQVSFSREGMIRAVAWCPNGKEFFAVYGGNPSKTTLYNSKCDPVGEFGDGARNTVLVNPIGNIVMIGGFGNISSRFETFDVKSRKLIGKVECPDITHIEWSPCGQYLLTSTCTPRLRVNNGFKVWHYSCSLVHEHLENELYRTAWLPNPQNQKPFDVQFKKVEQIQSKTEVKTGSSQRYIPPSLRNSTNSNAPATTRYLSQQTQDLDSTPVAPLSKTALKNKKKREAARKKKDEDFKNEIMIKRTEHAATGDEDKDKKIRNITKKLDAIAKLKAEQEAGKNLEKNQLEKISTEAKLLEELEQLKI